MGLIELAVVAGFLVIFVPVQVIIARGFYSQAQTQGKDPKALRVQRLFAFWSVLVAFVAWIVAMFLFPNNEEVTLVGGGTILFVGAVLTLPVLASMGKLSRRAYVLARISLAPLFGLLMILLGRFSE